MKMFFFHFKAGKNPLILNGQLVFDYRNPTNLKNPVKNDRIIFIRKKGPKGWVASPWTFEKYWLQKELELKTVSPTYRVISQTHIFGNSEPESPRVEWQGNNLQDEILNTIIWNKKYDNSIFSGSDFQIVKWWEKLADNNKWSRCEDPRN